MTGLADSNPSKRLQDSSGVIPVSAGSPPTEGRPNTSDEAGTAPLEQPRLTESNPRKRHKVAGGVDAVSADVRDAENPAPRSIILADHPNPSNCSIATGGSGCFARWRQRQNRYLYDQWGFRIAHCYRTEPHTWHRWTGGNEDLTCPGLPGAGE